MTTAPGKSQTTFSGIFKWRSLKTRVALSTLAIFLVSIWSLSFYASQMLREDMQRILGEQQFSTVSIIAADINGETGDRLRALEKVAARITPAILGNAVSMQTFLEDRPALEGMFSGGLWITRLDGTAIASVPVSIGRIGINYIERDYLVGALKGKLTIGKPAIGKKLGVPSVIMASPIRDTGGKVVGALIGGINLGVPNFLGKIADNRYGKTGRYLLVAPQYRLIITASDKSRIMEVLPAPGVNPLIDRFIQGYEGSGITIRPVDGVEILASAKGIPVSGWYVAASMPTEEAFAPIRAMMWRMLLATIFLSLLAGILTREILKRQLAPVFTTIKTLAALSETDQHQTLLPITRQDEIGALISGFNRLLGTLGQRDKALRESEERFILSMEATSDGLWDWNIKNDEIYFSPGYYRMLDYEIGAFPGEGSAWKDLIHPNDRENTLRVNMDCIEGHRDLFEVEYRMKAEGGEWRWILGRGKCIARDEQGRALRLVGTHVDITERKLAEEALNINKAQLSTALEMAHLGHWEYDVKTDLFTFNDHFYKIFRTTVEQVGGYTMHSAEYARRFVHHDDFDMVREETQKAIETTDPHFNRQVEHRILYADGKVGYINVRFLIVKDSHGRTVKTYGVNQDITEQKQAEEEKRSMEERLNRAEKMEALGTLAGGVAHDLNNVLGIVVGYAEMLMDEMDEENPMRNDMMKILEGGNRSAAIVQDLLTLARRGVQTKKSVNLNATITDCQKLPEFEEILSHNRQVNLQTDLESDLLNIMGSPVHLAKTIINLVSNAVEAMPNGGVLKIATANQYLDMPIHGYDKIREGDYVVLTVTDTGEGILERDIKRIFEPFYTKKIMGRSGTGLGLAVVWGTIKDHNGYINVESEEGKGTTFTLYFPVTREEMESEQISVSMSEYMGNGETILIVDDINRQRELASRMLTKLNYSVSAVASGEEAIEYLKTNKADLIVLDMIMDPGIDGLETYENILEINPVQKAVIVSGFSESDRVKEAQRIGAGAYVPKPYVLERLGMAVRKELDRKIVTDPLSRTAISL